MPSGARFNVHDSKRIQEFIRRMKPFEKASVWREVGETLVRLVEQRAKEVEIVRGRGLTSKPLPDRLSFRSGRLTRSISTDTSQRPARYIAGTSVRYSPQHEQGIAPWPKRAFLEPAAQYVMKARADKIFKKAFERARAEA